eukprot:TRINITY_DN30046_c0_g1_i2.p1 TRINITY_DN30046_c0_g1~~TRINITY_DN30046_c0_g1_i2.p1  ORF type:complete len:444 (+),score=88.79 TRINITY_DN30046_c0_g1_i2:69-1400(+)
MGEAIREHIIFHEVAAVSGIWILVIFVGVHTLSAMRLILVPLFWAFFLMMGLLPLADLVEVLLLRLFKVCGCSSAKEALLLREKSANMDGEYDVDASQDEVLLMQESSDSEDEAAGCCRWGARMFAVLFVSGALVGAVTLFFVMIYSSAKHMQANWSHYQDGAQRLATMGNESLQQVSHYVSQDIMESVSNKAVSGMEESITFLLNSILENLSTTLTEGLMMLLYMMFWLFEPMHVTDNISKLFRQYILLKMVASAAYAICVYVLLFVLNIDLAIVFAFITFLFNFVPEVGPFIAMVMPLPVILFDGRLEHPVFTMFVALGGNLGLKFLFGNIIEVKLIESQHEMKMHPVIILFLVAFFGWVWGATGMLLSVPFAAVCKASMQALPPMYRDTFLVLMEGDKKAPRRYARHRAQTMQHEEKTIKRSPRTHIVLPEDIEPARGTT